MKSSLYVLAASFCLYIAAPLLAADKKENSAQKQFSQRSSSTHVQLKPVTSPFGIIYSKNAWSNTTDFISNGNATANLSGSYVNISSSSSDDWNNTVYISSYQTKLEKWHFKLRFKIMAWAGNSYGLGFGLKSANPYVQNDVMGFLQTTSSGSGGLYILKSNRTIITTGTTALNIALNDVIDMEGVFYDSVFHFTATNITSGFSANVSYTFASNGSTHVVPNTSHFSLMELGGTHQIQNIEISSEELTGANIVTIGDSKTIGYFSNSFAGRYAAQLNNYYPTVLINAGGADRVTNVLDRKDELIRLAANKYLLSIGSNDIRFGSSFSELQANYDSLVQILESTGATVYHIVLPEDYNKPLGVDLLQFKDWIAATYPAHYINVWDSISTGNILKDIYDYNDGVHLNQAGNDKIYEAIVASNKLSAVILPVRLLSFAVQKINRSSAKISWKTDPFEQAEKYTILKSRNGIHFEPLISQAANIGATYNYTDDSLYNGINYYQLQMTEHSGVVNYSNVIIVQNDKPGFNISGLQKINADEFIFFLDAPESIQVSWQIIDAAGRRIRHGNQLLHKGDNATKIRMNNLAKGSYYINVIPVNKMRNKVFSFIN